MGVARDGKGGPRVGGSRLSHGVVGEAASASSARKRNDAQRCAVPCCAVAAATVKDVRDRFAASESSRERETESNSQRSLE